MFLPNMVEWTQKQMKYKIGDIIQFKHWMALKKSDLTIENGVIVEQSDKWEFHWVAKSFNTNELVHLKEDWITKLN